MGSSFTKSAQTENLTDDQKIVDRYVNMILSQKRTNIKMVPDHIERNVYMIVFTLLLYHLQNSLEKSKLVFMDHEITFHVRPLTPEEIQETETGTPESK